MVEGMEKSMKRVGTRSNRPVFLSSIRSDNFLGVSLGKRVRNMCVCGHRRFISLVLLKMESLLHETINYQVVTSIIIRGSVGMRWNIGRKSGPLCMVQFYEPSFLSEWTL